MGSPPKLAPVDLAGDPVLPTGVLSARSDAVAQDLCESACRLLGGTAAVITLHSRGAGSPDLLHAYERRPGDAAAPRLAAGQLSIDRRGDSDAADAVRWSAGGGAGKSLILRPGGSVALALTLSLDTARSTDPAAEQAVLRMLDMWWSLRCGEVEIGALRRAIEMSDIGVLILDAHMQISFANRRAQALLEEPDGLVLQGGGITAAHLQDAIRLQVVLHRIVEGGASGDEAPLLSIRRPGRRALLATAVAAPRRRLRPEDPASILFLLDPELDVLRMLGASCSLYGLTETESRLTRHLVSGLTITEAAAAMRIQGATARAYLKQVFAKTDTHRQTDLVRLMLLSVVRTPGAAALRAVA